ncbi:hypothetical protein FRB98_006875 [Tulasnella sp. 332]|nr:hypothetical protein FRB98_006875 [Tulasnella sp. 332]
MSITATLGVKITYNLNDNPQLRLARHVPIPVAVYTSSDECAEASASSSSAIPSTRTTTNKYDGCFAELPLRACLSALKDASPELVSNPSFDYSVYVNDPTESSASESNTGVLVGKGLLSSCIKEDSTSNLVFGKVVKDGIRGQSVLVHFTPRMTQEIANAPIPSTPSPIPQLPPQQQQHPDPNINALLSLLSSASSSVPQSSLIQPQQTTPDMSQLFSALAGCYGLGSSFPYMPTPVPTLAIPAPSEVIVIKEEDDVVEVVGTSSTTPAAVVPESAAGQKNRRTSLGKENIPPMAHAQAATRPRTSLPSTSLPITPNTTTSASQPHPQLQPQPTKAAMSKSRSTSHLHLHKLCDPSTTIISRNQTPFLEVPALQPMSALTNVGAPTTVVLSGQSSQKKGKELPGPHGNGWYRRTDLPPMTSSDASGPPPGGSVLHSIVVDANRDKEKKGKGKKKRSSDASVDGTAPRKRAKNSKDVVEVMAATSPAKGSTSGLNALGGLGSRVVLPAMSATSPIKPTIVKKITLKHGVSTSARAMEVGKATETGGITGIEDKKRDAPVTKIRTLNFLSLATARPPNTTTTSQTHPPTFAAPLPVDRKKSMPMFELGVTPSMSLPCAMKVSASSPIISSLGLALPGYNAAANLPARPSTPPPSAKRSPSPPRTPSRRRTPKVDVNVDEDGGSPLFLDSPVKTDRKLPAATAVAPSSPSPTPMARSRLLSHCRQLSLEDREKDANDADNQNAKLRRSPGQGATNLPMFDFSDLPPSSPPASFPSSSPSVSPRFTLDSVMDGMDEAEAEERMDEGADVDVEASFQETTTITSSFNLSGGTFSSSSLYSDNSATASSSTMPPTSDASNNTNVDLDWSMLADVLGMRENTKADVTTPMPIPDESARMFDFLNALGIVQPTLGVEQKPMELAGSDIFDFAAFNGGYEEPAKASTAGAGAAYEDEGFLSFVTSFGDGTT